jgi:hypothetical protein
VTSAGTFVLATPTVRFLLHTYLDCRDRSPLECHRSITFTMFADAIQPCRFCLGMVSESLDHFLFFDTSGNLLSNVNYTLVEVPEPSAWSMLVVGLLFFAMMAIRGMRCFHWTTRPRML